LVNVLADTAQKEEARKALATAAEKIAKDKAPLALAHCYDMLGDRVAADRCFGEALERSRDNAVVACAAADFYLRNEKHTEAEALLEKVLDGSTPGARHSITWARRTLAACLAAKGGHHNLWRALELVEQNLYDLPGSRADLHAKAVLFAAWPARQRREQAISLYEQLRSAQWPFPPEEELQLAQLYSALGDPIHGDEQIARLAKSHPHDASFLRAQVRALLRQKKFAEADTWRKRLEQLSPDDFTTVRLRAEVLAGQGDHQAALQALCKYADSPKAGATASQALAEMEDISARLHSGGQSAAAAQFLTEAESRRRTAAASDADSAMELAAFLGRRGHATEAIDIVQQNWKKAHPPPAVQALGTIVESGGCRNRDLERVSEIVIALMREHGRETSLLGLLARVRLAEHNYLEAEKHFREALDVCKDPSDFVPLNNLAFLLGSQRKGLDEAAMLIDKAISIAGPLPTLLDTRATIRAAKKQYAEALSDLTAAIADTPTAIRYFHLAEVQQAEGHAAEARQAIRKAEELGLKPDVLQPQERSSLENLQAMK
jgi:tetratricopeptide (TPR) repeat protein